MNPYSAIVRLHCLTVKIWGYLDYSYPRMNRLKEPCALHHPPLTRVHLDLSLSRKVLLIAEGFPAIPGDSKKEKRKKSALKFTAWQAFLLRALIVESTGGDKRSDTSPAPRPAPPAPSVLIPVQAASTLSDNRAINFDKTLRLSAQSSISLANHTGEITTVKQSLYHPECVSRLWMLKTTVWLLWKLWMW